MKKMKMHSPNLTDENIVQLRQLFPGCVTETKDENNEIKLAVDFDQLKQELSDHIVEGPQERYQLNWPGKREALLTANAPIAKTLRPCREESVDFDTTQNLFIEGDNLEALKLLQETYLGKVKMIYIDPPYNTGKDFIYEDDFSETSESHLLGTGQKDEEGNRLVANTESNGRFHSDWISMMYSRLKLARNLLSEDGVIFISIDDGEIRNVLSLCYELFGESNFVACLPWQKKVSPSNDSKFFSNDHEYIVVVSKNKIPGVISRLERTSEHNKYYKNPDNDPKGSWNSTAATCNKNNEERPNLYYSISNPNTNKEIWPRKEAVWAFSKETMNKLIEEGRIYWGAEGKSESPRIKNYLTDAKPVVPRSVLLYSDVGHTQAGTSEFRKILPGFSFDYPKPTSLLIHLLKLCSKGKGLDDYVILDFFAGSATTAHAVMQLNAVDGGERKFVMIQIPEDVKEKSEAHKAGYETIAEISKERIRRAGNQILEGDHHENWDKDIGFRVLKIDTSNMADVYYSPDQIKQDMFSEQVDNIKEDRDNPEDLLFQVLLDWGVDLSLPIRQETIQDKTVLFVDDNALVACFDTGITEELVKELAGYTPLRVVFRDNGFVSDAVKINVDQIFRQLSPGTEVKSI